MEHVRRHLLVVLFALFVGVPCLTLMIIDEETLDLRVVEGGSFALQTAEGTLTNIDLLGKTVLIFFGYLSCPDYCPIMMTNIAAAFKRLSDKELSNTRALFISVDPGRDTPIILEHYTRYFHQNIIGATTTQSGIDDIVKKYGSYYTINYMKNSDHYTVNHSMDILLMIPSGEIATKINHDILPIELSKIIRNYL